MYTFTSAIQFRLFVPLILGLIAPVFFGCSKSNEIQAATDNRKPEKKLSYELKSVFDISSARADGVSFFLPPVMVGPDDVAFQGMTSDYKDHPVYRTVNGKVACVSRIDSNAKVGLKSFAVSGPKTYFVRDVLYVHEDGRVAPAGLEKRSDPKSERYQSFEVDAEGDMLVFFSLYEGVSTWKNGIVKNILPAAKCSGVEGDGGLEIGGGRVFICGSDGIYGSTDSGADLLVPATFEVAGRQLSTPIMMSAGDGGVAFVARGVKDRKSDIFIHRNGTTLQLVDTPQSRVTWLATNGKLTAYVEVLTGYIDLGTDKRRFSNQRLVVHNGSESVVVATAGEKRFGGTVTNFMLGLRGIDAQGNIAFVYGLAEGKPGIGIATAK